MRKTLEVERVESKPDPTVKTGPGILPNTFHKMKMSKVPTDDCDRIYTHSCIPCSWINQYVATSECESCRHGKVGSYSEGWVLCNYRSSKPSTESVTVSLDEKWYEPDESDLGENNDIG